MISGAGPSPSVRTNPGTMNVICSVWKKGGRNGDSVTPEVEVLSNMIRQYFSQERSEEETIRALNHLRRVLHEVSPFAQEPVDCVLWVKADEVVANDYNPNVMSSSEKNCLNIHWSRMDSRSLWWFRKRRSIIWSWMVFIVSCWAGKRIRENVWRVGCQWPVLIRKERDRHHVLPQPYGITVPGKTPDNVNVWHCQGPFASGLDRWAYWHRVGHGPGWSAEAETD